MGLYDLEARTPARSRAKLCSVWMNATKRKLFLVVICSLLGFSLFMTKFNQPQVQQQDPWSPLNPHFLYDNPGSNCKAENGPVLSSENRRLSPESLRQIRNKTLGFGDIQVINVKERTDRLDAVRLTSSLLGFDVEIQTAVNGADVSPKLAEGFAVEKPGPGAVGAWQSHMEAARNQIERGVATSLLLQDDADFDISLRSQLELFALGSQTLLDTPRDSTPLSPYGDGWDILWFGHCASSYSKNDSRRFLIKNDPTVPPSERRHNLGDVPDISPYDESTRVVYFNAASICLHGQAFSLHGAQKVLKYLSMDTFKKPVDLGMMDMCNDPDRNFKCISVFPQLFGEYKPAGNVAKDSDIRLPKASANGGVRKKGFTHNIVYSARLNAEALMDHRYDKVTSQWPNDTIQLKGPVELEYRKEPEQELSL